MSDTLAAAGVTPQESATQPVEEERSGGTPLLDPEKVAVELRRANYWAASADDVASALCEAYKEGRLTDG